MDIRATSKAMDYIMSQKSRYHAPCLLIHTHTYKICIKTATVYRVDLEEFIPAFNQQPWIPILTQPLPIPLYIDSCLNSSTIKKIILGLRIEEGRSRLVVARISE